MIVYCIISSYHSSWYGSNALSHYSASPYHCKATSISCCHVLVDLSYSDQIFTTHTYNTSYPIITMIIVLKQPNNPSYHVQCHYVITSEPHVTGPFHFFFRVFSNRLISCHRDAAHERRANCPRACSARGPRNRRNLHTILPNART